MTVESWLNHNTAYLLDVGIATARLDCLVLLEDILNTNRTQILAHPKNKITEVNQARLDTLIAQRARHIPLAYLRRKTEFYGRQFYIDERVLEPRPESEMMIDILLRQALPNRAYLADVGSGSGALGLTAKLERPDWAVTLLDIDSAALSVSRQNARLHNLDVQAVRSDLLSAAREPFDVLLCNLPYVPDDFHINTAALHEPRVAIFGGPDGLELYRKLFAQIAARPNFQARVLTESMPPQHSALAEIASSCGYIQTDEADFIQLFERN